MEFKKRKRPLGVTGKPPLPATSTLDPAAADDDVPDPAVSEALSELLALRALKRSVGGIELDRLNAGDVKKHKTGAATPTAVVTASGMLEGTRGGIKDRIRDEVDDADDKDATTRRIVKSNNFTGQTNAVDVDKHMMAYIEEELRKRKAPSEAFDAQKEIQSLDPRDALYKIAEKYRVDKKPVEEGNVSLSTSMLTAIPEVDLGIDTRLKNIEETEKAKRHLFEEKQKAKDEDEGFAADRFYRSRGAHETDSDALAKARKEALGMAPEPKREKVVGQGRRELATDDQVMDRFKKRQQGKR